MHRLKLSWLLFAVLLVLCGAVTTVLFTPEPENSRGLAHPDFSTMQIGGDSVARYEPIRIASWVFALACVCLFSTLLMLANRHDAGTRFSIRWMLGLGCVVHLVAMTGALVCYESYIVADNPNLQLGFPTPSTWMLFAVWPAPLVFVFVYVLGFNRWIFRDVDEQAFRKILSRHSTVADHDGDRL